MAVAFRATKTVIQSILMSDPAEKLDPSSLQMYMSGCCILILLPVSICFEPEALVTTRAMMEQHPNFSYWLIGNSMLAFFVNLTNLLVTKLAGPLTLQVIGNAKGVVCAIVSVIVFRNPVTAQGILGYVITVFGTILYSESKKRFEGLGGLEGPVAHSSLDPTVVSSMMVEVSAGNESGWQRQDTSPNKQGSPKQIRRYHAVATAETDK